MQKIPQRVSLVAETEKILIQGMIGGKWRGNLPGQRSLGREMQVGRWTLSAALKTLSEKGYIRKRRGHPCEILARSVRTPSMRPVFRVGVVVPEPLCRQTPFTSAWMADLRSVAQAMGLEFNLYSSPGLYGSGSAANLREFVESNPNDCWILLLSTQPMQRWFSEAGVPAIVAGSLHEGVRLPSVDTDFRAIGRHALGRMIGLGHRRIAVIALQLEGAKPAPGVIELECGAREACDAARHSPCELTFVHHAQPSEEIAQAVDLLLESPGPPTALLIVHSAAFLGVLSHLAQRRITIPRDLSVVVAQDEPYFPHIVPELSHYEWNANAFTHSTVRLIKRSLERTLPNTTALRIVPRFVPGKTLRPVVGLGLAGGLPRAIGK